MKVLQIHPFLRGDRLSAKAGGKSRVSLSLTCYLKQNNVEVAVFPYPEKIFGGKIAYGLTSREELTVLPTVGFPEPRNAISEFYQSQCKMRSVMRLRDRFWRMMHWVGLRNTLREFHPDIVHLHMSHSDFPMLYRAGEAPQPLVLTHHTGQRGEYFALCDFIICISAAFQDSLLAETNYKREHTRILHCPVSDEFLGMSPLPASKRTGIVFVGRPNPEKGIDLLCEAYACEPKLSDYPLTVCGQADDLATWSTFAAERRLPIQFHGRLSTAEVCATVRNARLMVIPSRSEGFSIALLEALACGTPVVGWAPQVRELEAIWGIPVGIPFDARSQTAAELADAILEALENDSQQDVNRLELAHRTASDFSIKRYGEEHLALYRKLLGICVS